MKLALCRIVTAVSVSLLQEQLTTAQRTLADARSDVDRVREENSQLERTSNEKSEEIQRLANELQNSGHHNEVRPQDIDSMNALLLNIYCIVF